MRPFHREGDDLVASLTSTEVAILDDLIGQIETLLAQRADDDPAIARLLPDAYRDDPEAASEFRRFTEDDLVGRKEANARLMRASLGDGKVRLGPGDVQAWLRSLTDLRLVIATRLGIEKDDDPGDGDPYLRDVYGWLGYVQSTILDALEG